MSMSRALVRTEGNQFISVGIQGSGIGYWGVKDRDQYRQIRGRVFNEVFVPECEEDKEFARNWRRKNALKKSFRDIIFKERPKVHSMKYPLPDVFHGFDMMVNTYYGERKVDQETFTFELHGNQVPVRPNMKQKKFEVIF